MSDLTVIRKAGPTEVARARTTNEDEMYRLKADIALRRQRVVASVGELRRRVDGMTSWRHWVRAHPVLSIAAALSLGFTLGGGLSRGRGSR